MRVEAMSLRHRLALVSAAGVAAALVVAAAVCYVVVRGELRGQVDASLKAQAARIAGGDLLALGDEGIPAPSPKAGGPAQYWQIVAADGQLVGSSGGVRLPWDRSVQAVAQGRRSSLFADIHVDGSHLRLLALGLPGGVVELARPLDSIDTVLAKLRVVLLLICLAGTALAAGLSQPAARRVLAPLAEVAGTAQLVSETEDLTQRIKVRSADEIGQLAGRFNTMLDRLQSSRSALDRSVKDQRQLVADASHELRTPVTSLRTNAELLLENPDLDRSDRDQLLTDVVEQSEELTTLVAGLIELARETPQDEHFERLRLDELTEDAVTRARRNSPQVAFDAYLEPVIAYAIPEQLTQALNNLLDNAARHSPRGEVVEIALSEAGLRVRDHGPGIHETDLPHVFDRFYRGTTSRGQPGSGLGLAIVQHIIEQHGGTATANNARDGGAIFTIILPSIQAIHPNSA
jgi:two-component system, OmpR family, sensor histidine kinase MprB